MYTMIDDKPVQLGDAFGYCFHPQIFGVPNKSRMGYSPVDNPTWECHPFLDTQEQAEAWLRERGCVSVAA